MSVSEKSLPAVSEIYVVYSEGEAYEGNSVYAICTTEHAAEKLKIQLAGIIGEYREHFKVKKIDLNTAHPWTIFVEDGKEKIS